MTQRVLFPCLAVTVTLSALLFATFAAGPLARFLFGVPAGFREDFTSRPAYFQALFVQAFSVGVGFLILGVAIGTKIKAKGFRQAVWIVNSITVVVGFGVYKWGYHWLRSQTTFQSMTVSPSSRFSSLWPQLSSPSVFSREPICAASIWATPNE